jgi:PAS domain S-box-containing protein
MKKQSTGILPATAELVDQLCQKAFDNSVQPTIITVVGSGAILVANPAAATLLGYSRRGLLLQNRSSIFDIKESSYKKMLKQRTIDGHSVAQVTAITKKEQRLPCEITTAIFNDHDGVKKAVMTLTDLSSMIQHQQKIDAGKEKITAKNIRLVQQHSDARWKAKEEWIRYIAKTSFDLMWDWDILADKIYLGDNLEELFGYRINTASVGFNDFSGCLLAKDKLKIEKKIRKALASAALTWKDAYVIRRRDGSLTATISRACIVRDAGGIATRMIGATLDITRQKDLEEKLLLETKLKEKQLADASEEAKESERSHMGKELHDNINQLLGASRMYMEMAKPAGTLATVYLNRSSEYLQTAIDEIRKLTKGLATDIIKNLGLSTALDGIVRDTMEVDPVRISCVVRGFIENSVSVKFKLNLFRIVQEQLNNILKHARATAVRITLVQQKTKLRLVMTDDGIGFDTSLHRSGIGINNIKSRALAFQGSAVFTSQPGSGCVLTVSFTGAGLRP